MSSALPAALQACFDQHDWAELAKPRPERLLDAAWRVAIALPRETRQQAMAALVEAGVYPSDNESRPVVSLVAWAEVAGVEGVNAWLLRFPNLLAHH